MKCIHPYACWAARVIEEYLRTGKALYPDPEDESLPEELFQKRAGCFVTLHTLDGSLRGCIGTILPTQKNLALEIRENAISAATRDPRFPPVTLDELDKIEVNVDVLGELEPVSNFEELDPKVYGVVVTSGYRRGVLLPDLPGVDTVEEQLRIASLKAGILPDEAKKIYRFKVERYH